METYLSIADLAAYIKAAIYLLMVNILFRQEWKNLTVFNTFRSRIFHVKAAVCGETAADFLNDCGTNGSSVTGRLAYRYAVRFPFDDNMTDYETGRIPDGKIQALFGKNYRSLCTSLANRDNTSFADTKIINLLGLINRRLRYSLIGNNFVRVSDRYSKRGQMGALEPLFRQMQR